ncbi:MAG: hypothetical protein A2Z25_07650 [Planctomycetes bacterium RBG_16_55_9]|nr:MAG: hypothetical protein A2Z25_07650 [Planctomycetes bacterium RBG_16_55_9]
MNILEKITRFVECVFKTSLEIFLEALKLSPNAQGYVSGSITELLLKKKLEEEYGFEVKRIREKWEGKKHARHHGDYYFKKADSHYWYVIEAKGVKSNSEKWHKLYNFKNLKNFLITHDDKVPWINCGENIEQQVTEWICKSLPRFQNEYSSNLYEYEEVKKYKAKRETEKAGAIAALHGYNRDQINDMIEERLDYVMSRVKVLETHFVSGTSGAGERTQATPRKDEFNVIAIDIVLRYSEHKFLFASPQNLESSGDDPNHLQQNYIMGFVFTDDHGNPTLTVTDDWYENLNEVYEILGPEDAVNENDMQSDNRYVIVNDE